MKNLLKATLVVLLFAAQADAHSLWVNSFESFAHAPGHTTVALGWGHALPLDDMPNSTYARVVVEEFNLVNLDGNKTHLYKPKPELAKPFISTADFDLFNADVACQKAALKKETQKGNYLIEAASKKTFYTSYVDKKGRTRLALKPQNQVTDLKKVLFSVQHQAFAKSYLTVGKWSQPKPVGHGLEITPLTDLSKVRVGDMVLFDARFHGKPLSYGPKSIEYITAYSSGFGLPDGFALFSYLKGGKTRFRVQSAG